MPQMKYQNKQKTPKRTKQVASLRVTIQERTLETKIGKTITAKTLTKIVTNQTNVTLITVLEVTRIRNKMINLSMDKAEVVEIAAADIEVVVIVDAIQITSNYKK